MAFQKSKLQGFFLNFFWLCCLKFCSFWDAKNKMRIWQVSLCLFFCVFHFQVSNEMLLGFAMLVFNFGFTVTRNGKFRSLLPNCFA